MFELLAQWWKRLESGRLPRADLRDLVEFLQQQSGE